MLADIACPTDLEDVLTGLAAGNHAIIAGGTDFVPLYAAGAIADERVLDITRIAELVQITTTDDGTVFGAAVRLVELADLSSAYLGAIVDGAALVGSTQTRGRATLGGNICRASPSGDTLAAILVTGAELTLASAGGRRVVNSADFFLGPGVTVLTKNEMVTGIEVPASQAVSAYVRSTVRNAMDLATVGVAVSFDMSGDVVRDARMAVGGAGPRPLLIPGFGAIVAGTPLAELSNHVKTVDALTQEHISPIDDNRGSAWYRRTLIEPVLRAAIGRAQARSLAVQTADG